MIKNLIKIAERLDRAGLTKEADKIDGIIKKVAGNPVFRYDDNMNPLPYEYSPDNMAPEGAESHKNGSRVLLLVNNKNEDADRKIGLGYVYNLEEARDKAFRFTRKNPGWTAELYLEDIDTGDRVFWKEV
jgi:hypothetical protein